MKNNTTKVISFLAACFISCHTYAQQQVQKNDENISTKEKKAVIEAVGKQLQDNYVFPELAKKMSDQIIKKQNSGQYKKIDNVFEFRDILTKDLRSVSQDKHISVIFDPEAIEDQKQAVTEAEKQKLQDKIVEQNSKGNFGFHEVKILEGNIGYLNLRSFQDPSYAGDTAVAAMNFLSNTDAIIIDLRQNGGGSPQMIQLISSYLFDEEPVHLNSFYHRPEDRNTQTWTLPHVSGKRNPDALVYVLTSNRTFSAAEEFSYNLNNLERGTLVGETTGGGAHPGGPVTATDRFQIWVPTGRAINPITKTNWEGTGVSPHIEVDQVDAFGTAYLKALDQLAKVNTDEISQTIYNWVKEGLKAEQQITELTEAQMQIYTGNFGPRSVQLENGDLYYQRSEGNKYKLIPMGNHKFSIKEIPFFRIEFEQGEDGNQVAALIGHYNDGRKDKNIKD